jgi:hypothetical protein
MVSGDVPHYRRPPLHRRWDLTSVMIHHFWQHYGCDIWPVIPCSKAKSEERSNVVAARLAPAFPQRPRGRHPHVRHEATPGFAARYGLCGCARPSGTRSSGNSALPVTRGTHAVGPLPRATWADCQLPGPDFHRQVLRYPRHTDVASYVSWRFPRKHASPEGQQPFGGRSPPKGRRFCTPIRAGIPALSKPIAGGPWSPKKTLLLTGAVHQGDSGTQGRTMDDGR